MNGFEKFKEEFYSLLTGKRMQWLVWNIFEMKSLKDYHNSSHICCSLAHFIPINLF